MSAVMNISTTLHSTNMDDGSYKFIVETGAISKTPMNSVAKRYRPSSAYTGEAPAFILVFTHATGFCSLILGVLS